MKMMNYNGDMVDYNYRQNYRSGPHPSFRSKPIPEHSMIDHSPDPTFIQRFVKSFFKFKRLYIK